MKRPKPTPARHRPATSTFRWDTLAWAGLLVLLAVVVYWPTLSNGFIWDDDAYVEQNLTLRTARGLADIWFKLGAVPQYYPLVHSTFWVEYHLWGLDPRGYHVINLLLHATAAVLAWRLLARLEVPGAWLVAALFAVHPVEVESVAWVTERKNVLSLALALGALLAYFRFDPPQLVETPVAAPPVRRWRWYVLALALFCAALLSKTVVVSMPAVILVIDWWKRGRLTWRDGLRLTPFFVVGIGLALVTVWMEKAVVGAQGAEWNLSLLARLLIAGRVLCFYAGKLVWPYPLIFFYPRWTIDTHQPWQYLFPLAVLAVMIGLYLARRRIGRGPLAAVLIFAGVLTPALGFFDVFPFRYSFVADHFQYHASLALIALLAAALVLAAQRSRLPQSALAGASLIAALAVLAQSRTLVYHDLDMLYGDTIARNPQSWGAYLNLGNHQRAQGKADEAIANLEQAVRLEPERDIVGISLGAALIDAARYDEAIASQRAVLARDPRNAGAIYNIGVALGAKGDLPAAVAEVQRALELNPRYAIAQHELGRMHLAMQHYPDAVAPLAKAVELEPHNAGYRTTLALALLNTGDPAAAEAQLHEAIALDPRGAEAHFVLGMLHQARGETAAALTQFQAAVELDPTHQRALDALRQSRASGR